MSIEAYLAYLAACILITIIPGPTVTLIIANSLTHGTRAGLLNVAGTQLGLLIMLGVLLVGLSSVIATMGVWFDYVRIAGAVYLVWLGIKLWRAGGALAAEPRTSAASRVKMLCHAWLVTALNPKSLTFFVAFLPQFLDPHARFATQMAIFEATFLVLAFANAIGYALVASRARALVKNPRAIGVVNKVGGTCLIGAGIAAVAVRAQ